MVRVQQTHDQLHWETKPWKTFPPKCSPHYSDHRFLTTDNFSQKKACCFVFDCRNGTTCFPFKNYFRRLHHDAFNLQTIGKQQNCPRSNWTFCVSLFLFFRCLDSQFNAIKFNKTLMLEFYVGKPWTIITCDFYCRFNRFLTYIF